MCWLCVLLLVVVVLVRWKAGDAALVYMQPAG
jgi:hypothetical protein